MNKLTTLLVGTGLAGAAILGAVAPATAAPTTPTTAASTQAAGDRLEGKVHFLGSPYSDSHTWFGGPNANPTYPNFSYTSWESVAAPITLPALGTTGPIIRTLPSGAEQCLDNTMWPTGGGVMHWRTCSGIAAQGWKLTELTAAETNGKGAGVAIESTSVPGSMVRITNSSTNPHPVYAGANRAEAHLIDMSILTPVGVASTPVDITGPAAGESVADETPTFSGTGEPGAEVVVKDAAGNELGKTTVGADGSWSVESGVALTDGPTTVTAEQTDAAGDVTSDTVDFIVAAGPSIPVIAPVVALGALGLAGAGALVGARRRKTARA